MAMNLPTPATHAPSRVPAAARGSLLISSPRSFANDSGESALPTRSGTTPDRSAMPPSASTRPGRSAPTEPKRTSFKTVSRNLRSRQTGRTDWFELFVGEDEFLVAERLGLGQFAACDAFHQREDLAAYVVEIGATQDAAGVHVHVVGHAIVGVWIGAHLDDRRDGGAHHRAAAGGEQDEVRAAGDQLDDLGIVGDVGESESRFAVRHHVEEIEAAARRHIARFDEPGDGRGAGLGVRSHGLFFERGEPAFGIARRKAAVTHDAIVVSSLVDAGLNLTSEFGRDGARGHDAFAADELAGFSEDAGSASLDEPVETTSHRGVGGDAAGAVGAAAHGADNQFVYAHGNRRLLRKFSAHLAHDLETGIQRARGATRLLDHEQVDRAATRGDRPAQLLAIEALAAQRYEQHSADVRVRAEPLHHLE